MNEVQDLVERVTDAAVSASAIFVPKPLLGVVDRTLVDMAVFTGGGVLTVAESLRVDAPAVDAWRSVGVPDRFRGPLTRIAMRPAMRRAACPTAA